MDGFLKKNERIYNKLRISGVNFIRVAEKSGSISGNYL